MRGSLAAEVSHEQWMHRVLDLARRGTGRVSPNPRVGCVIVHNGTVIAEGWHDHFGGPHAERAALQQLSGKPPADATLYVNLEPCDHHGKQPPCTDAIIASGIKNIVVGMVDPYEKVAGRGLQKLRDHGLHVEVGVLADECAWINRGFVKHVSTAMPHVILKIAQTVDGIIAAEPMRREQLTGSETLVVVHQLRQEVDAVMVGLRTVQIDDPSLTVREIEGRNPIRIVVDPMLDISMSSTIVRTADHIKTIVVCSNGADTGRESLLADHNVECLRVPSTGELLDLGEAMVRLGARGIGMVMCEGGPFMASTLLDAHLVNELRVHIAPKTLGTGHRLSLSGDPQSFELHDLTLSGSDVLLTYLPVGREK